VGPYHIIGFSIGGTIAYEMARQLYEAGETVAFLGVIETGTDRYRDAVREARAAFYRQIVRRNISLYQAAKRVFGNAWKFFTRLNEKAPCEVRHALGLAIPHNEREYFYMRWFRDIEGSYVPKPYHGPITLFASQGRLDKYRTMWAELAAGGLVVRDLPLTPDHSSVVLLPNSRFLAMQIDASLNELAARTLNY
jgi:thioesterase domain-containing protein